MARQQPEQLARAAVELVEGLNLRHQALVVGLWEDPQAAIEPARDDTTLLQPFPKADGDDEPALIVKGMLVFAREKHRKLVPTEHMF